MKNKRFTVLGVMSGTSLDGIDIALLTFEKEASWNFQVLKAETIPYPQKWEKALRDAFYLSESELEAFDVAYTAYLGKAISGFIREHKITGLDAVCSHGHTIWHRPEEGVTVQIGNRSELAGMIGYPVVCDFRVQDVELGGQGAPLVPIGDRMLFADYEYCLNLGGFANVSQEKSGVRLAYDICAVNTVLNHYASKLGLPFDRGGEVARSGKPDMALLDQLDALSFYQAPAPKSLGVEYVGKEILPLIDGYGLSAEDALATYTLHVARQLAEALQGSGQVLVTGGGAFNAFLLELLRERTGVKVVVPENDLVNFKEALIFGFLGVLRLRGEVNCLSSVTGARRDHSSGRVYEP